MNKIVLIHNIISPHTFPVFTELGKRVNLTVLYCAEKEENRIWKEKPKSFKYKILPNFSIKFKGSDLFTYFINLSIFKELNSLKPEIVIISGWDLFAYQAAFFYCKLRKIKIILWSGSTKYETSWRRTISKPLVKLIVNGSDAYIAYGTRAKEYLISLGANPNKIFISFNTTGIGKYSKLCVKYKREHKPTIVYYGQLIERKGADILIKAFFKLKGEFGNAKLLIIGSGQYKKSLEQLVGKLKLSDVKFIDNPGDDDVCKYYAVSDILVLPSREEVWGLIVNQAMACGLAVVVSDICGSSVDLVKDGVNGYVFKSENVNDLSNKLMKIIIDKRLLEKMKDNSRKFIEKFTPEKVVKGVIEAIESV